MTTTRSATDIADSINATGETYYGSRAKGWEGEAESRIYFGKEFVRILKPTGEITNARQGKARALTIGSSALDLVVKHS